MQLKYLFPLVVLFFISCGDSTENAAPTDSVVTDSVVNESFLMRTGQNVSYTEFDDGHYQTGAERTYSKTNSSVSVTGKDLIWQDDSSVSTQSFQRDEAYNYCLSLTLDGQDDWRLPTLQEMFTLTDFSKSTPALDDVFVNSSSGYFWSSTICPVCASSSFAVAETTGIYSRLDNSNLFRARCVRGETLLEGDFVRNDAENVVSDNTRKLMWQDANIVDVTDRKTFVSAIDYCENLDFAGYQNWRLPNISELRSLLNFNSVSTSLDKTFVESNDIFFSSTTDAANENNAWTVNYFQAFTPTRSKTDLTYARCVRNII